MNYDGWLKTVPVEITGDPLWNVEAYRLALYRATGSIGANTSEGYSRGTGKDPARFYEYALGSARETRGWYFKGRRVLGETVASHRIALVTQIIRRRLTMIPNQREDSSLRENSVPYICSTEIHFSSDMPPTLLSEAPLPALTDHSSLVTALENPHVT